MLRDHILADTIRARQAADYDPLEYLSDLIVYQHGYIYHIATESVRKVECRFIHTIAYGYFTTALTRFCANKTFVSSSKLSTQKNMPQLST